MSLLEQIFSLRMTVKQMERLHKRCEKEEQKHKNNVSKYIRKGDKESARLYAENALRKKQEGLSYLRMAGRLDAVVSRLQTAQTMKSVTKNIGGVVKSMDKAMASMDLQKVSKIMDAFESQFENLDVQAMTMESSMSAATTLSTPEDEVDALIQQTAESHGLELQGELATVGMGKANLQIEEAEADNKLKDRLAQIRAGL